MATQRRVSQHPVVLFVQDTTELDYTDHPQRDAKYLADSHHRGLFMHAQLAITPEKLCLGVVAIDFHERELESLGKSKERRTWPIEEKESFRWLNGYRRACELGVVCPETQIVMVADREGDISDIFVDAQEGTHSRVNDIVRAQEARSTFEPDLEQGKKGYRKVRDDVAGSKMLAERTIALAETPKRKAREATVEIRAIEVKVKPPHARAHLPSVTYNVVYLKEIGGPQDGTDVDWLLITTLPIDTIEEILLIVDYYIARWAVEIYFLSDFENRLPRRRHPTGNDASPEELLGTLLHYRLANPIPDLPQSNEPNAPMHGGLYRQRMEICLEGRSAKTPSENTAAAFRLHGTPLSTQRLQQSSKRTPIRTFTRVGRTPKNDGFRDRLGSLLSGRLSCV